MKKLAKSADKKKTANPSVDLSSLRIKGTELGRGASQKAEMARKRLQIFKRLWPDMSSDSVWNWNGDAKGWVTMPRILPLYMRLLDENSSGKPVSYTYLDLWSRSLDGVVKIHGFADEMAYASGFSGERAVSTWSSRLERLEELGAVVFAKGPTGKRSHGLLRNPYHVAQELRDQGLVSDKTWNAFRQQEMEIGAAELEAD